MSSQRSEVDFDHNSAAFAEDPHAHMRRARERCPMAWTPHHGGYWVATGYEAMSEVARDDARFSSPVYPGETVIVDMWVDGNVVSYRSRLKERDVMVINNGRCLLKG